MRLAGVLNFVLLLAVIVGHLVIVRELIGRAYRVGMPWGLWLTVGGLLVAAGVSVPWALVVRVGRHGPKVLRGGRWWDAPVGWQVYAGACLAVLLITSLARLRSRKAAALIGERGETIDVGARLDVPAGRGVGSWVARVPGNQLFHVELAEREIALPNLPRRLDGLSILHLTDLHFNGTPGRQFFEHALELAAGRRTSSRSPATSSTATPWPSGCRRRWGGWRRRWAATSSSATTTPTTSRRRFARRYVTWGGRM